MHAFRLFTDLLRATLNAAAPYDCCACGVLLHGDAGFCAQCAPPPQYIQDTLADGLVALSLGPHEGALRRAVHRMKYEQRADLAPRLGAALRPLCQQLANGPCHLVAMPASPARVAQRGYNQSALLVQGAGDAWLPWRTRRQLIPAPLALARSSQVSSQIHLSGAARRDNLRGAVQLRAPVRPRALRWRSHAPHWEPVILIDDVLTTGATAQACAAVLQASGATVLGVVTLTRAGREFSRGS